MRRRLHRRRQNLVNADPTPQLRHSVQHPAGSNRLWVGNRQGHVGRETGHDRRDLDLHRICAQPTVAIGGGCGSGRGLGLRARGLLRWRCRRWLRRAAAAARPAVGDLNGYDIENKLGEYGGCGVISVQSYAQMQLQTDLSHAPVAVLARTRLPTGPRRRIGGVVVVRWGRTSGVGVVVGRWGQGHRGVGSGGGRAVASAVAAGCRRVGAVAPEFLPLLF